MTESLEASKEVPKKTEALLDAYKELTRRLQRKRKSPNFSRCKICIRKQITFR